MLTLAILGYATWWAWKKYVLLQNVQLQINSVSIDGGLLNPRIKLTLLLKNPTPLKARVTELDGFITDSNKNKIGKLSIIGVYEIDPDSYIIIPVMIETTGFNILNTVADFYYKKQQDFNVSGFATVDQVPIPYQFNFAI